MQAQCTEIFISEYCEGTGNNKGVEFTTPPAKPSTSQHTSCSAGATGKELQRLDDLIGAIEPHGTWVLIGQPKTWTWAVARLHRLAIPRCRPMPIVGQSIPPTYMNGDDALVLVKNESTVVDIFGKPGEDPGVAWTNDEANGYIDIGDGATWLTSNHTLAASTM